MSPTAIRPMLEPILIRAGSLAASRSNDRSPKRVAARVQR
jgi:hypothetical protein